VRLEEIYSTPFHTHSPMEPHATIAVWDGADKLTLYDTSQGIFGDRKLMASLFGLQLDNVRVVSLFFGRRIRQQRPSMVAQRDLRHGGAPRETAREGGSAPSSDVRPSGLPIANPANHLRGRKEKRNTHRAHQ
jgi:hypothetical protein